MNEPPSASASSTQQPSQPNPGSRQLALVAICFVLCVCGVSYLAYYWLNRPARLESLALTTDAANLSLDSAPPADENLWAQFDTSNLTVNRDEILRGGPWKDGISSVTTYEARPDERQTIHGNYPPKITTVSQAVYLSHDDRIVGVTIGQQSRAYPIRLLDRHELVNDVLGDVPIAVIYCPLCDSVSVIDRRIGKTTLEFGVSGMLHNSNVLLYDRTDHALWSQVKMEAISGPYSGESLKHLGGWTVGRFDHWSDKHPNATVISFDTGFDRRYQGRAYQSYFTTDQLMFPVKNLDERISVKKTPIIGVRIGERTKAYPLTAIEAADGGRIVDKFAGQTIILVSEGDGQVAIEQMPNDANVVHTYWFTWGAFWPDTEIYGRE